MNDLNHNEAEPQNLTPDIPFRVPPEEETNEGTNLSIRDPDRMLSLFVLILACLGLAILAHVIV